VVAATYWFAAQALTSAYGFQAIVQALSGHRLPLVPVALGLAAVHAALAVLGFDVMRYVLRVVLPLSLVLSGVLLALYLASDDPRFAVRRVFRSPDQHFTWLGFATFATVSGGSSLTYVTNIADFCRYTPTRRDMTIGLWASGLIGVIVPVWVGAYAAVATGKQNPFLAAVDITHSKALLVVLILCLLVQSTAVNITNVYTAGLSLVNSMPRLGRLRATALTAVAAVALSAFPDFVEHAQKWLVHLGNVAAPLAGVLVADYVLLRRCRIDVAGLFDPDGPYRYLNGVNVLAFASIGGGVAVYYALPHTWLKVAWGIVVGAVIYLALVGLQRAITSQPAREAPPLPQ
jgi:purine-cytosine permease-like protein